MGGWIRQCSSRSCCSVWGEGPLGSGFGANVSNYVFKSEVPKMVFFDGLGSVLRSGFGTFKEAID